MFKPQHDGLDFFRGLLLVGAPLGLFWVAVVLLSLLYCGKGRW